jgi:transposase
MQQRLEQKPDIMRVRRQTVEHPFGTIKAWMGATHFLTGTLKRVSTEMSLHVLAYNLKRVIATLDVSPLIRQPTPDHPRPLKTRLARPGQINAID